MSDRRPENPRLYVKKWLDMEDDYVEYQPSPADLLAAVRRGVESGTIKGEEIDWCETHWCTARDEGPGGNPGVRYCYLAEQLKIRDIEPFGVCEIVPRLVFPVSDGGSET